LLTLHGRYDRRSGRVLLTGRFTVNGKPRASTAVVVTALIRRITGSGDVVFDDRPAGIVRTNAGGSYRLSVRLQKTTGFVASGDGAGRARTSPATAPKGCLNTTLPGAQSGPITVSPTG